jgi:hypothetical protein
MSVRNLQRDVRKRIVDYLTFVGLKFRGDFTHEPNDGCHYYVIETEEDADVAEMAMHRLHTQILELYNHAWKNYTSRDFFLHVRHEAPEKVFRVTIKVC